MDRSLITLLILIGLLFILMKVMNKPFEKIDSPRTAASNSGFVVKTILIEGCEYFAFRDGHGVVMITHKGNCNNPVHQYRVEK